MDIAGRWLNEYGSVLELTEVGNGRLVGEYSSHTGHTGRYLICGVTGGDVRSPEGLSVALSLFWRSLEGDADPSWHWVSGFSGQSLQAEDGSVELGLLHVLLTTTPRAGVPDPGSYIDKLRFVPAPGRTAEIKGLESYRQAWADRSPDPIQGHWRCCEQAGTALALNTVSSITGLVCGVLTVAGQSHEIQGFTDTAASRAGLPSQCLSLTARLESGMTVLLVGALHGASRRITATVLTSQGTSRDGRYVSTTTKAWTFAPELREA